MERNVIIAAILFVLVVIGVFGLLWWKIGFGLALGMVGAFFFSAAFFVYEGSAFLTGAIGVVLIIVGVFLWQRKKKANLGESGDYSPDYGKPGLSDKYQDWQVRRAQADEQRRNERRIAEENKRMREREVRRIENQRLAEEERKREIYNRALNIKKIGKKREKEARKEANKRYDQEWADREGRN